MAGTIPGDLSEPTETKLPWRSVIGYSLYAAPLTATAASIVSFIPPLYSEGIGLSLTTVGACMLAIRAVDAVVDPAIGWLVDRTPFRRPHRPWLLITLPVYLIAVWLLFFPVRGLVGPAYLFLVGSAAYMAFTVGQVAHQAWGAALARDPAALSRLFGLREVAVIFGILGAFGLAAISEQLGHTDMQSKASAAGAFILAGITLATLATVILTPDPIQPRPAADLIRASAWPFLRGKSFVCVCLATLTYNFAWVAYTVLGLFITKHVFGVPQKYALGLALSFVVAPLAMPIWMGITRRVGNRRSLLTATVYLMGVFALLPVLTHLPDGHGYLVFAALLGGGFGAGPYLLRALTGALANRYEVESGTSVRGAAFAVMTFFDKAGSGLGAIALLAASAVGFEPSISPSPGVRIALLMVGCGAPLVGLLATGAFIWLVGDDSPQPNRLSLWPRRTAKARA